MKVKRAAEKALLRLALEECDTRITRAKASVNHYEREHEKLTGGLRRAST